MTDNQGTCPICPICNEPFKENEVLVRYLTWDKKQHSDKLGHLDCVLYLLKTEEHKHPPTLEGRIDELESSNRNAHATLAARITKLGG